MTTRSRKCSFICDLCTRNLDEECILCQRATHNFPGFQLKVESFNHPDIDFNEVTEAERHALAFYIFQGGEYETTN